MYKHIKIFLLFVSFNVTLPILSIAQSDTVNITTSAQCTMCKKKIEDALRFEKGVKFSNLDVTTKTVTVIYNGKKTDAEKIRKAITMLGYDADNMPADSLSYNKLHECCKKPHLE